MACSETVCLVLLAVLLLPCSSSGCMFGIPTLGATFPAGDIFLEKGQSLKITCKLNKVDNVTNAKKIFFTAGKERVPKRFVNVIDMSTAELLIPNMTLTNHSVYYCRLQTMDKVVCLNQVVVGLKPQEPKNLTCISENWQSLVCNWDKEDHYLPTSYTILYTLAGRGSRSQLLRCPGDSDRKNNTCLWDFTTSPIYRTVHEFYTIIMTGYNALGNVTFPPIRFHHYAHVIPNPPENLCAQNVTTHSVVLKWVVAYPMQNFPPGLITRVEFRHKWIPEGQWIIVNTTNLPYNPADMTLHITNLPYAHTNYTIRVQHKSQRAQDKGYSEPATVNITTESEKPTAPPKVDIGGFENEKLSIRNIYLYWERIPECLYNSDGFEYQIEIEENGALSNIVTADKTASYIKIKNLSHNAYTFNIYAKNNLGVSDAPSVITVPHYKSSGIKGPLAFTKIEYDDGVTELSWNEPDTTDLIGSTPIIDYTIFWCENTKDKAFQCTGSMNWIRVPAKANWHNVTIPDKNRTYQFAISANGENESSGLSWTVCTVAHDKVIEGLTQVSLSMVGSTFLGISWNLQCSHRIGQVLGYNFRYCPIFSANTAQLRECKEPSKVQFVQGDANTKLGNITGLMPYTAYMYNLTVLSKGGEGVGETQFATTLEAAPEPPSDLVATNVTNSSIHISWKPPARPNGNIKYYEVNYTVGTTKIDGTYTEHTLVDLPSFTNVSIYLRACTIACSNKSNVIMERTLIGTPSKIDMVHLRRQLNESNVKVSWNVPVNRAGYIDFYELWVEEHGKNASDKDYTVSNQTSQLVSIPDCFGDKPLVYIFRVRAVNKDEYNQSQYGPWSDPREENCYSSGFPSTEVIIFFSIFAAVILVSVVWCYGKRFWICLEKMRNVPVELPPGLDPSSQTFAPTQKPPLDSSKPTPEDIDDSEMLLTKSERHGRNPSGDSSGCSSAGNNDSISLTSNRQISTDSGTEADQLTEGDSTQVQVHVEMDPVDAVRNWQVMPDKFTPDQSNQQIEMLSCMQTYCKIGEANNSDVATTGPYIMLGEQQQPPQENNKGSNGYVTVEQVDLMLSRQESNGYSAAPPNGFMLRKGSTSTAEETPSSCSSRTSSASGSPTLPQAALNGYAKVGNSGPPAPPKSANSSGYVALGDVNLSFKPPQHEDETPKIKQIDLCNSGMRRLRLFLNLLLLTQAGGIAQIKPSICIYSLTTSSNFKGKICKGTLIFEDNFTKLDPQKWTHEITMAGGGNNEFQIYWNGSVAPPNASANVFITDSSVLNIKPNFLATTYSENFLTSGNINLGKYCTASWNNGCNRTGSGSLILPPITSARLHTINTFNFRYGTVQVRAQLPAGDWIWPAIWMMPKRSTYGTWPRSGEIDIMESRGNRDLGSFNGGTNIGVEMSSSTLHWGPDTANNRFRKTNWERKTAKGNGYDKAFHLYEVQWTPDYIKFSIDGNETGRVTPSSGGFWQLGNFSSSLTNIWANGTKMAPFDQEFFLILNVAVGGTTGMFPDGISNPKPKPWSNASPNTAFKDFWSKRADWEPTWKTDGTTALKIDYVRVYAL
ncbi:Hypothetical predicted protein [Cloeon dipterum]|nr:Hypothetical predicted protein [Cloeon dipterum]